MCAYYYYYYLIVIISFSVFKLKKKLVMNFRFVFIGLIAFDCSLASPISGQFELAVNNGTVQASYLKMSPFYRNEKNISSMIEALVSSNRDNEALNVMREVIAGEKIWRYQLCCNLFGKSSCLRGANVAPFFMWKKKLVHDLLMDPTQEIIDRIRKNVGF